MRNRWLYTLILTVDANFHLKNKKKAIKDDPPLGDGWAHVVEEKPYMEYVRQYGYQAEVHEFIYSISMTLMKTVAKPLRF
jgi:hypothetical protein